MIQVTESRWLPIVRLTSPNLFPPFAQVAKPVVPAPAARLTIARSFNCGFRPPNKTQSRRDDRILRHPSAAPLGLDRFLA